MKKRLFLGVVLLLAGAISFLVFNRFPCEKVSKLYSTCRHSESRFLNNYLKLAESQRKKVEDLEKSFSEKKRALCDQICDKRNRLSRLLTEASAGRREIDRKVEEINSLQGELEKGVIDHIFEVKAILTPEQQDKFLSLIAKELCRNNMRGR